MTLQRYKMLIEYDGTEYAGWQIQKEPHLKTIQGQIQKAVHGFCGQKVTVQCAGRTDAGVHAWGQIAHMDLAPLKKPMSPSEIAKAINAHMRGEAISILEMSEADAEFHARFSAKNKLYVYRILNRASPGVLEGGKLWHIKRALDLGAMQDAAQYLLGEHDFTTFRDTECQAKNPIRTLDRLDISSQEYGPGPGCEIRFEFEAQSFLHHMVRNIVGTLALVGEGKWQIADVQTALEAKDRIKGGPTAPACGLYLKRIDYPKA